MMIDTMDCPAPLASFVKPMLGLTAWGVKQRYGSFLTFEFGQPKLEIKEHPSRSRRLAYVHGEWHLWIYCCHWRIVQGGEQLAWSEDDRETINRAAAALNGQNLTGMNVPFNDGRSSFDFDLGGSLETWPYGDDAAEEQWMIYHESKVFSVNATSAYALSKSDAPLGSERWSKLR
jgi:hypothetical protein